MDKIFNADNILLICFFIYLIIEAICNALVKIFGKGDKK